MPGHDVDLVARDIAGKDDGPFARDDRWTLVNELGFSAEIGGLQRPCRGARRVERRRR
jgi:hypothetical protein